MPDSFPCILLHKGLAPYAASPDTARPFVSALHGDACPPAGKTPPWDGPAPGLLLRAGESAPVFLCGECTSTFDVAWELLRLGALPAWGSVLALSQTQGRGQLRRFWHSPAGNLYVSLRLPDDALFAREPAALVAALLAQRALAALQVPLRIKWPNDLLLLDDNLGAKVGGLLLEERGGALMAGLGLNLNHAPAPSALREAHAVPATALRGRGFSPLPLWLELVARMRRDYAALCRCSLQEALHMVEAVLAWKNVSVVAKENNSVMIGYITGLGAEGELLLLNRKGAPHAVRSGSIVPEAWRDAPGV